MALNVGVHDKDGVCDGEATAQDSVYEPVAPPFPETSTAYVEPGVAAMLTRDCWPAVPHASSLEAEQVMVAKQLATRPTTSTVSNDADVHVSTVSTQPAGLLAGTVMSH